jgi:hypothetical protein
MTQQRVKIGGEARTLRLGFGTAESRFFTIECDREPGGKVQVAQEPVKLADALPGALAL